MTTSIRFRFYQKVALLMAGLMAFQAAFPLGAWALTSGPAQPEFSEFEPVGTTQMVDLFSGDFTYNIPLFELPGPDGGYPFNLSYHSGITMDQEATWVGLGWTMNHGAITRTMRGLPDDFNGDEVWRKMDMLPNRTWNFGVAADIELFGFGQKQDRTINVPASEVPMQGDGSINPTDPERAGHLSLALGLNVMHNNYKGWGLGFNTGLGARFNDGTGPTYQGGLNLGVNTNDGASLQPNFSIGRIMNNLSINANADISGRDGMESFSLGFTKSIKTGEREIGKKDDGMPINENVIKSGQTGFSHSFGRSSYSPQVAMPYRGMNFSGSFKGGFNAFWGSGVGAEINASFTRQRLRHANTWRRSPAYGYFNMRARGNNDSSLSDFNREKDGPIRQSTPNLGTPITTPDIYTVTGQGIGGSYRAYRSDIGILSDPYEASLSGGGVLGVEVNPGNNFDLGVDLGGNFGFNISNNWEVGGTGLEQLRNTETTANADYEPYYFKAGGEMTAEPSTRYNYIGGDDAVRIKLANRDNLIKRLRFDPSGAYQKANGEERAMTSGTRTERKPRANSILPITNEQLLLESGGEEALKEYRIEYYDMASSSTISLARPFDDEHKREHVAGLTATQANGARYVYALPVKNHWQEEMVFSVNESGSTTQAPHRNLCQTIFENYSVVGSNIDHKVSGTEEYLNHTRIPEYTHAYLLTSILGADYVDLDTIAGPSDGDYGYWVKFNYVKTADRYKWRAPYYGANFQRGKTSDPSDDKGSIMYGEREQYYLASAETRTHIAEFSISARPDARGAGSRTQVSADGHAGTLPSFRLDEIQLFSKLEKNTSSSPVPIKKVKFKYDYSLCKDVNNNDGSIITEQDVYGQYSNINTNNGKLTLKNVWFEYRNNTRGSLSPYEFTYANINPEYSDMKYDRWGTYKSSATACDILRFPYSEQIKGTADNDASVWHLTKITLPSGAEMNVEYESDQYAYVQDREAMRMFPLAKLGKLNDKINTDSEEGELRHPNNSISNVGTLDTTDLHIYFDLDDPVTDSIEAYVDALHGVKRRADGSLDFSRAQLYYKIMVDLNGNNSNWEYISGYAEVDNVYLSGNQGVIRLRPAFIGAQNNKRHFHPFAVAVWQWLKIEYPSALYTEKDLSNFSEDNFGDLLGELASSFGSVTSLFKNYYRQCSVKKLGELVDLEKSFIRLVDPDHVKFGGGSRVAQITIDDHWDVGEDGIADTITYGQVFDYTTVNEEGAIISSGVASNEPSVGYDECALRYAKKWSDQHPFRSDENLFYEYPNNETYYPGAGVGYSKVTVKSLATHYAQADPPIAGLPTGFATTGETVNEFYTAKDFPTLVEETRLDKRIGHIKWLPLPGGSAKFDKYTGSQGYAITLNDMHGKPHKVTHYGLDDSGNRLEQKLSEVIYTYAADSTEVYTVAGVKKKAQVLTNEVDVLIDDGPVEAAAQIEKQQLGVDIEFFTDMRQVNSFSQSINVAFNIDFMTPIFISFTGLPRISINEGRTRTAVTNKVIRKSGILTQIDAYDGQSHIRTNNRVFDPMTGEPLLTTVNNSFDNLVYNYNVPARLAYDRMGEAYKNIGLNLIGQLQVNQDCGLFEMVGIVPNTASMLVPGDECVVTEIYATDACTTGGYSDLCENAKFVFIKQNGNSFLFENNDLESGIAPVNVNMLVTRSGRRNHLGAKAASITALKDPTKGRTLPSPHATATIPVPEDETTATDSIISIPYATIDSVLSASAIVYSDDWDLERSNCEVDSMLVTVGELSCNCLYIVTYSDEPECRIDVEYVDSEGIPTSTSFLAGATGGSCLDLAGMNVTRPGSFGSDIVGCHLLDCYTGPIDTNSILLEFSGVGTNCNLGLLSSQTDFAIAPDTDGNCGGAQCSCLYIGFYTDTGGGGSIPATCDLFVDYTVDGTPVQTSFNIIDYTSTTQCLGNPTRPIPPNWNVDGCAVIECTSGTIENVLVTPTGDCGHVTGTIYSIQTENSSVYCNSGSGSTTTIPIARAERSFHLGQKGIWRPLRDYTYVEDRNISHRTTGTANVRKDGTFNYLPLFNWENPFFVHSDVGQKWKHSSETTKYARNGEQVESRDVLGLYSSALYGYQDNLPTAVAANARYYEMAFESFEEHKTGPLTTMEETGHFDFACDATSQTAVETYDILGGYVGNTGPNYIWLDKSFYANIPLPHQLTLVLQDATGREIKRDANVAEITGLPVSATGLDIPFRDSICVVRFGNLNSCDDLGSRLKTGRAIFSYCYDVPASTSCNASLSSAAAHTGEHSLKVTANSTFDQRTLRLEQGREYVLSAWVHRQNVEHFTFDNNSTAIKLNVGSGSTAASFVFRPEGEIIEGWQRIEGVFEYVTGGEDKLTFEVGVDTAYFDDLRIYPLDGGMQTYVYDPVDYRLRAVLDNNNFATLYYYDSEGNLFLQKKETARGIKTIQETKQYIINRTD